MRFATSVGRLLTQVGHWEQGRWSAPVSDPPIAAGSAPTKGDLVYALVQRLADLGADAENRPRLPVPRLTDMTLPDQLRVMSDDLLVSADEDTLASAADQADAVRRAL